VLRHSGLNFTVADGIKDAVKKVVTLANQQQAAALELQNRSTRRRIDEPLAKYVQRRS
jgi:hypothetical protein